MTMPNQCQFWDCDIIIPQNHFLCYDHYAGWQEGEIDECPQCGDYKDAQYEVCLDCYRQPAVVRRVSTPDAALLEELRVLRRELARYDGLQDFMVFSNATLEQIAAIRPTTPEALLAVNGVGPAKMGRYGADVLRVIRASVSAPPGRESRRPTPAATTVERDDREFAADQDANVFFVYILMLEGGEYYIGQTRDIHERLHEHRNNMVQSTRGKKPKLQWFARVPTRADAQDLEAELQQLNSHPASRRQITQMVTELKRVVMELDYEPH